MGCMGALVATSQLPAWAEDKPSVFPQRGSHERMSLSYAVVEIGLERPFSVLHISDSHLTAAYDYENERKRQLRENRTATFGGRQEEALRDALEWARLHVDYVVHTGDLIDWQSEANFDLVRRYFGPGSIGAPGNHEFSPEMWLSQPREEHTEAFKDLSRKRLQKVYPFDLTFQSQVVHGVNFITMDDVYGYVTKEQTERFWQEVERGLPIVLCLHVPLLTKRLWRMSHRFWNEEGPLQTGWPAKIRGAYKKQQEDPVTRDFIARLQQEPLLRCILAGHVHFTAEDQFSPTCREYVVAGSFLFHGREVLFL